MRHLGTRAQWAIIALGMAMVSSAAGAVLQFQLAGRVPEVSSLEEVQRVQFEFIEESQIFTMISGAVSLLTIVTFMMWHFRAHKNVQRCRGRPALRWTPGWTVGGWFIPLANLVIPYLVMRETLSGAKHLATPPEERPKYLKVRGEPALNWWWTLYTSANVFSIGGACMLGALTAGMGEGQRALIWSYRIQGVVGLFAVVAAILIIMVIRRITGLQAEMAAHAEAWPEVVGPPDAY